MTQRSDYGELSARLNLNKKYVEILLQVALPSHAVESISLSIEKKNE
jgi:hypothetical protein